MNKKRLVARFSLIGILALSGTALLMAIKTAPTAAATTVTKAMA